MINYIISALSGFILSSILFFFFFKYKNNIELSVTLNDLKKSINDFQRNSEINAKEVQNTIKDAANLAKILTTNQNLKGQFGEDCLEIILKACYPNENINYIKQYRTYNDDDNEIKPDYLIKLPNNKSILIDCKVNLEKYIAYKESENSIDNKKQDFIKDLNSTINNLANKKYETAIDIEQPDFIIMYIPLEPVITTIYTDKDFIGVVKNASDRNIIIAGNSSILTIIKLTKLLWAQDIQNRNIDEIILTAKNVYNSIAQHSIALFELKEVLNKSIENFNKEYDKITKENSIFKSAQQLNILGIEAVNKKTGKKLNEIKIHSDFIE